MQLRTLLQTVSVVFFMLTGGRLYSAELKIGYVDLQVALQTTSTGKNAKAELERDLKKKKDELEKQKTDLEKQRDDLEKKKDLLSDVALQQKAAEFQQQMLKYREEMTKGQMEIQKKERDLTAPIFKQLSDIITAVAKEQGYDMILEKSQQGIVWAKKEMDLTEDIMARFEKQHGKGGGAKK